MLKEHANVMCCAKKISGNPGSVGSVGGSVGSVGPAVKLSPAEEHAYLEKWKQLQKYIDPLKRMINRIDKDEGLNFNSLFSVTLHRTYDPVRLLLSCCLSLLTIGFLVYGIRILVCLLILKTCGRVTRPFGNKILELCAALSDPQLQS